jgi:hypothetical protein
MKNQINEQILFPGQGHTLGGQGHTLGGGGGGGL